MVGGMQCVMVGGMWCVMVWCVVCGVCWYRLVGGVGHGGERATKSGALREKGFAGALDAVDEAG